MNTRQLLFKGIGLGLNAVAVVSPRAAGNLAFQLFSSPPKPNVRPKERDFLSTEHIPTA